MPYVRRSNKGRYRGQDFEPGTILPMDGDLANKVILAGKGSPATQEEYDKQQAGSSKNTDGDTGNTIPSKPYKEMTFDELSKVEYTKLNRDPLVEYATACGLTIEEETKKDIYALIENVDFKGGNN